MPSAAERRLFLVVAATVTIADIVAKLAAEHWLGGTSGVAVVGDWVQFRLVFNPGAAFGVSVGSWSRIGFSVIAVVAIVLLARLSRRAEAGDLLRQVACGLVAGGALGNLLDRLRSAQGVVDFLDVGISAHRWPTFNVADIGVTVGAFALAWSLWREDQRAGLAEGTPEPRPLP